MLSHLLHPLALAVAVAVGLFSPTATAADKIVVGHLPVTGHAKFFVAKEKGFFAEEGLDVELLEFANSADGLAAVRAGKLDVGAFGTLAPLVHIAQGADLHILGGVMGEDAFLVTKSARAGEVKNVADLKGKKIATVRLASGDAVLRGALNRNGISWKTDVELSELKNPPAVIEAVKNGQVDVGVIWGPFDQTVAENGLQIVLASADLYPGHPCCRLVANDAKFKGNGGEVWKRFLRAMLKAERFARGNPANRAEVVAIIGKYVKLAPEKIENAYYAGRLDQATDPNVQGVEQIWQILQDADYITANLDITKFIETAPYKNALDSLVAEEPDEPFWQNAEAVFAERDANVKRN
ncbi:hypothetical protein FACS1894139_07430 [Planctomycetales bacterium]|nr:hypothetical protein FACS1894139_07430 [Planctomycetales bacterium]